MDEDLYGNAAGSFSTFSDGSSTDSKSAAGKAALLNMISTYKNSMRLGIMTYKLAASGVNSYYLHGSPYFASYEPKSYCPVPPDACVAYCITGNTDNQTTCRNSCQAQNASFDETYRDELLTNYAASSAQRKTYCGLVYPKTQRITNPTDTSNYIYYKQALPFYDSSNDGTAFCYSGSYNANESTPWDSYSCYTNKTGTNDTSSNYSSSLFSGAFSPTDSDYALGYQDFGRRLSWWYVGRTWFNNSSPGIGYLKVPVAEADNSTQLTALNNQVAALTETQYMACSSSDKNTCSYIVNAGLTPTEGTFNSALQYFQGTFSQGGTSYATPIQYSCQRNYIIYVTDGAPSTDSSGNTNTTANLMPNVISKITSLRNITVSGNNYDVKTYVVGLGLTDTDKMYLDNMSIAGGTDYNGHAYYVDNLTAMQESLNTIFSDILNKAASGTSASVLADKGKQGANILQAAFYPLETYNNDNLTWSGHLYNFWLYNTTKAQNIREETLPKDYRLNVVKDKIINFTFTSGQLVIERYNSYDNGSATSTTPVSTTTLDNVTNIWEAGSLLFNRTDNETTSDRRMIYVYDNSTVTGSTTALTEFTTANKSVFQPYMGKATLLSATSNFDDVIKYIRGTDKQGLRPRTITIGSTTGTWKLGDIIYSTPLLETYDNYTVVYAGGNDGMLHAFELGMLSKSNLGTNEVAALTGNSADFGKELWGFIPRNSLPYLRYLADPKYCHLYYADLQSYVYKPTTSQKILIGGMRLGGACGYPASDSNIVYPPNDTCTSSTATDGSCVGLSSYYALDITNPTVPKFLWEFSHPNLGFSLSGPAVIKSSSGTYVMFLNGPQSYTGYSAQNLQYFVIKLNSNMTRDMTFNSSTGYYIKDFGSSLQNAYGGRLFTTGLDMNGDGYTDYVVFGYVMGANSTSGLKGGLINVWTGGGNPLNGCNGTCSSWSNCWNVDQNFFTGGFANRPVTSKITIGKCFYSTTGLYYVFGGSGRYMTVNDTSFGTDQIFGIPMTGCQANGCCGNVNSANSNADACAKATSGDYRAWSKNLCDAYTAGTGSSSSSCYDATTSYLAERDISDPTLDSTQNIVLFATTRPSSNLCSFGGASRAWSLNCATGQALTDNCTAALSVKNPQGTLFLQLSTAQIKQLGVSSSFNNSDGSSGWFQGITPESAPPFVSPGGSKIGAKIHWIER
ncbi:pilus assembly protein [Candidatus Magnetomonas plexicatena]|uniref:pilus assembly protein n=1 Tax=Candidatus Magnetomonas plexicatena TaxID=2552947 RepID=UPI001C76D9E8|nr:hypothetical protein E2O03_003705 [Nitrospirales bacterium LBB_01]